MPFWVILGHLVEFWLQKHHLHCIVKFKKNAPNLDFLCREQRLKSSGPCRAHRLKIHIKCSEFGWVKNVTEEERRNFVLQGWDMLFVVCYTLCTSLHADLCGSCSQIGANISQPFFSHLSDTLPLAAMCCQCGSENQKVVRITCNCTHGCQIMFY